MAWGCWLHEVGGEYVGAWLRSHDPDVPWRVAMERVRLTGGYFGHPTGYIETTTSPSEAMRFAGMGDILREWKRESTTVPRRADGLPNRPLSAFTIEPRKLPTLEELT